MQFQRHIQSLAMTVAMAMAEFTPGAQTALQIRAGAGILADGWVSKNRVLPPKSWRKCWPGTAYWAPNGRQERARRVTQMMRAVCIDPIASARFHLSAQ